MTDLFATLPSDVRQFIRARAEARKVAPEQVVWDLVLLGVRMEQERDQHREELSASAPWFTGIILILLMLAFLTVCGVWILYRET